MQFPTEPVQKAGSGDRYLVPQSVLVRAVAYLIDSLLFALLAFAVLYALDLTQVLVESGGFSWLQLSLIAGQCGYFFIFEAAIGRSPGKIVMALYVVGADGRRCGVWASFLRNLIRPLDLLFFGVIGAVSILSGFKRQRLGDRLAHTQVVRELPLALIPPPYVPADKKARRCPRCGALSEGERAKCGVCGFDLDSAPPWPFGGMMRPGGPQAPGAGPAAGGARPSSSRPDSAPPRRAPRPDEQPDASRSRPRPSMPSLSGMRPIDALVSQYAVELLADDPDTRLFAARQILLDGERDDVKALIRSLQEWDLDDAHFVVNVARTLDGWRPILVLEALRNDADEELAESAKEALQTVRERTDREEEERKAWEEARRTRDEDDEYEEGDEYEDDQGDEYEDEAEDGYEDRAVDEYGDEDAEDERGDAELAAESEGEVADAGDLEGRHEDESGDIDDEDDDLGVDDWDDEDVEESDVATSDEGDGVDERSAEDDEFDAEDDEYDAEDDEYDAEDDEYDAEDDEYDDSEFDADLEEEDDDPGPGRPGDRSSG